MIVELIEQYFSAQCWHLALHEAELYNYFLLSNPQSLLNHCVQENHPLEDNLACIWCVQVFKAKNRDDGRLYAVKRCWERFRGSRDR